MASISSRGLLGSYVAKILWIQVPTSSSSASDALLMTWRKSPSLLMHSACDLATSPSSEMELGEIFFAAMVPSGSFSGIYVYVSAS